MKRSLCLAVLMALGSPACARDSYSFNFHGHHIHIEASRNCRSLSCVSVTVPGVGHWHNGRRDDPDDVTSRDAAPAPLNVAPPATVSAAPAPASEPPQMRTVPSTQPAAPALQAPVAPAVVQQQPHQAPSLAAAPPAPSTTTTTPPPAQVAPAAQPPVAAATPPAQTTPAAPPATVAATPPAPATPPAQATPPATTSGSPPASAPTPPPAAAAATAPAPAQPAPPPAPVAHPTAAVVGTSPVGDWQTEAKSGLVRIEACGEALCGYMLDAASNARGETILVNMKPKADSQWSGNVFSRSSGNSYYGTMTLKEGNTLRVEACALGQFFCSGNNWTRVAPSTAQPNELVTSHQASPAPHS